MGFPWTWCPDRRRFRSLVVLLAEEVDQRKEKPAIREDRGPERALNRTAFYFVVKVKGFVSPAAGST